MQGGLTQSSLAIAVMDALSSHICVIDLNGVVLAVNQSWKQFTSDNSADSRLDYVGCNYLDACRDAVGVGASEAPAFVAGVLQVLNGQETLFQIEYTCHSPSEMRWYLARVTPLLCKSEDGSSTIIGAVISHINITDRKAIELKYARLASTDPLTGLPNRRFFDEFSALEFGRFKRFKEPASLVVFDLDHFKAVNDVHGHLVGDEALRRVGAVCYKTVRACDLLARLGGEEFICLLPGTDGSGARITAEKLRTAIERTPIIAGLSKIQVTASFGIAVLNHTDAGIADAFQRADAALYQAKSDGRNCVRCVETEAGMAALRP